MYPRIENLLCLGSSLKVILVVGLSYYVRVRLGRYHRNDGVTSVYKRSYRLPSGERQARLVIQSNKEKIFRNITIKR